MGKPDPRRGCTQNNEKTRETIENKSIKERVVERILDVLMTVRLGRECVCRHAVCQREDFPRHHWSGLDGGFSVEAPKCTEY